MTDANLTQTEQPTKFRIRVSQTTQKEIDVDFPYFAKYGDVFYNVKSSNLTVIVELWDYSGIGICVKPISYVHPESAPCTEEEFNIAYEFALSKIQNL